MWRSDRRWGHWEYWKILGFTGKSEQLKNINSAEKSYQLLDPGSWRLGP